MQADNTKNRKTRKILLAVGIPLLCLLAAVSVFFYFHPTHYRFNDRFVIGSTMEEIRARYGDFDKIGYISEEDPSSIYCVSYLVQPRQRGFLGTSKSKYYAIFLDENGIATRVEVVVGSENI